MENNDKHSRVAALLATITRLKSCTTPIILVPNRGLTRGLWDTPPRPL